MLRNFITTDSNKPITTTVYLIDNNQNYWQENDYKGDGMFGGKNIYELYAEMNNIQFPMEDFIEYEYHLNYNFKYEEEEYDPSWVDRAYQEFMNTPDFKLLNAEYAMKRWEKDNENCIYPNILVVPAMWQDVYLEYCPYENTEDDDDNRTQLSKELKAIEEKKAAKKQAIGLKKAEKIKMQVQKTRIAAEKKRIAEEKKAEKKRIAEEKKAEKKRIAEEKKAEKKRIAEEKKAEKKRIAEEKKAEKKRIAEEKKAEKKRIAAEKKAEKK